MTKSQRDGLLFLLLGGLVFVLLGGVLERASAAPMLDFKVIYYSARSLAEHHDPYVQTEVWQVFQSDGGKLPLDTPEIRQIATTNLYLPTAFAFTLPLALLPWGIAHSVWMTVSILSLLLASLLVWNLGANCSPIVSGILVGFLLANSEVLIVLGNTAGLAVGFCVIAVWCFLRERFVLVGLFCLAASLAIKPQDAGLVWLYFLLAGGVYRRRALQTLLLMLAFCLPAFILVYNIAPNWMPEWHANLLAFSARGGLNDPGPASGGGHGIGMLVSLQPVFSVFWDDPRIYNPASYLVCAPLIILWIVASLRRGPSTPKTWLGLAAVAALSMLPVYHREYDAKLLLLTVPACAMLWAEGGKVGRIALLVTSAAFLLTGDLTWATILSIISGLQLPTTGLSGQILTGIQVFPAPFALLIAGVFYLWIYVQRSFERNTSECGPSPSGTGKPIESDA